jgi:nitroreductase
VLLRELVRCATLAANGHNTQPWKFGLSPDTISIRPDLSRRTRVVDPDEHHLWVSLGCATENLVLAAAALGKHADIAFGPQEVHVALDNASPCAHHWSTRFSSGSVPALSTTASR